MFLETVYFANGGYSRHNGGLGGAYKGVLEADMNPYTDNPELEPTIDGFLFVGDAPDNRIGGSFKEQTPALILTNGLNILYLEPEPERPVAG